MKSLATRLVSSFDPFFPSHIFSSIESKKRFSYYNPLKISDCRRICEM